MKKTKKQMVAAGLALVMAVSLVGCGNSGGDSQKEDGQITIEVFVRSRCWRSDSKNCR